MKLREICEAIYVDEGQGAVLEYVSEDSLSRLPDGAHRYPDCLSRAEDPRLCDLCGSPFACEHGDRPGDPDEEARLVCGSVVTP